MFSEKKMASNISFVQEYQAMRSELQRNGMRSHALLGYYNLYEYSFFLYHVKDNSFCIFEGSTDLYIGIFCRKV